MITFENDEIKKNPDNKKSEYAEDIRNLLYNSRVKNTNNVNNNNINDNYKYRNFDSYKNLKSYTKHENFRNYKKNTNEDDMTLVIRRKIYDYIDEIEAITGRKISDNQKEYIEDYVANNSIIRSENTKEKRAEFNVIRSNLIEGWEKNTNQVWPKYEKDVISVDGKVLRNKGRNYDVHHIIESSYDGPNKWWNMHPAAYPNEHQEGIHRLGSVASQIFPERDQPLLKRINFGHSRSNRW